MSKFKKTKGPQQKQPAGSSMEQNLNILGSVIQLNQQMIQRTHNMLVELNQEFQRLSMVHTDTQYKLLALMEATRADKAEVQKIADRKRIEDFDSEVFKKNQQEEAISISQVESKDNIVVITSTTGPDNDQGILRSRIRISEMQQPDLEEKLLGKRQFDEVEAQLNGATHKISILDIYKTPEKQEIADEQP